MEEIVATEPLARVDYLSIVDTRDLEPLQTLSDDSTILIAAAVYIGKTRLIDNVVLNGEL
jgi:pantoate--beta-alanine ligase